MRYLLLALLVYAFPPLNAQPGCTDPQAINYNPAATENDGSCTYQPTNYSPPFIAQPPADLEECSGLSWFSDRLWTHEDGGGEDLLYVLDTVTGEKLQIIPIPNADNKDWEDLAENDEYLFVGDFGNNDGNRTDLHILRIKKTDLLSGTALPEVISFSYSDQTNFDLAHNANNFDCEAFFFWNDSLHLFSKNWLDFKTRHYVLPAQPGTQTAMLRDSLDVQGLITGADVSDDGKAVLLGYNFSSTFLWLLWDFEGGDTFSGNKRKITMGSPLFLSQVEGIAFKDNEAGYIISERFSSLPPKLHAFDIGEWTSGLSSIQDISGEPSFAVSPNPFYSQISIRFLDKMHGETTLTLMCSKGETILSKKLASVHEQPLHLDLPELPAGMYFLVLQNKKGVAASRLVKR